MSRCIVPAAETIRRSPRTTTSYAVLGLLSVRSWTTYELAKQVQRSLKWFWPRAERKLYDEPKGLVAEGLATARQEYTGQRPRTVYEITGAGREALRDWLGEPPAPPATEFEGMLKVFFADGGSLEQLAATLARIEATAGERVGELLVMADQGVAEGGLYPRRRHISALALPLQLQQETSVLEWARWARAQVAQWRAADDPGHWDDRAVLAAAAARARAALDPAG